MNTLFCPFFLLWREISEIIINPFICLTIESHNQAISFPTISLVSFMNNYLVYIQVVSRMVENSCSNTLLQDYFTNRSFPKYNLPVMDERFREAYRFSKLDEYKYMY